MTRRITASWSRKPSSSRGVQWLLLGAAIATEVASTLAPRALRDLVRGRHALVAVFGEILFNDPAPPLAMAGMVLIVGGVVLVGMSGPPTR